MAEEKSAGVKRTLAGWIKAGLTTVFGLMSGAVLMYLTPLINNTIKPAKPVANFATQLTGLTVAFNNHSTGGSRGWWDFGDGTALVPFTPNDAITTHTYGRPGTYNVKLTLHNRLGEESERSVAINVDGALTATSLGIDEFEAIALTGDHVPATFQLKSKVKNASFCIFDRGDDRPLQLDVDSMNQDRYVVFDKAGTFMIRLAAVSGKEIVEKSKTITVKASDPGEPIAKLHVSYQAVKIKRDERRIPVQVAWGRDPNDSVCPFREERPINPGFVIVSAQLVNKDDKNAPVQKVKLEIAPDKTRVILTGELVKPTTLIPATSTPTWLADIKVAMERRSPPINVHRGDVMMAVNLNSTIKLPMPPLEEGWEVVKQNVNLEILEGGRKAWEGNQAVTKAKMTLKNQECLLTMSPQKGAMVVRIETASNFGIAPPSLLRPVNFERLPLLPRPK